MVDSMNNPPAFPVFPDTGGGHAAAFQGMTLRDYFAAKAMQAWESRKDLDDISDVAKAERFYELADAMLRAREEK
jgi:hypothetical protein